MTECTQCPHTVGDSDQRDCAFPDCVGGWEQAYKDAASSMLDFKNENIRIMDELRALRSLEDSYDTEESVLGEILLRLNLLLGT